jgi:hypothetical protein
VGVGRAVDATGSHSTRMSIFAAQRNRPVPRDPVQVLARCHRNPPMGFSTVQKVRNRRWFLDSEWGH